MNKITLLKKSSPSLTIIWDLMKLIILPAAIILLAITIADYSPKNASEVYVIVIGWFVSMISTIIGFSGSPFDSYDEDLIKKMKHAIGPEDACGKRILFKSWWLAIAIFFHYYLLFRWSPSSARHMFDGTLIVIGVSLLTFIVAMFRYHNRANKLYLMVMDDRKNAVEIEKISGSISTLAGTIDVSECGGAIKKRGKFFDYFKVDDACVDSKNYLWSITGMKTP